MNQSSDYEACADQLIEAGRSLFERGMVPATSGNFSCRLHGGDMAITVSGRHKGRLTRADIMRASADGVSLDGNKPSAETRLHVQIYRRFPEARCVLHPHSVNATVLSRGRRGVLELQDYELLKAFPGIDTHEARLDVPIFANDQNIDRLAAEVDAWMDRHDTPVHGYLIAGHGFYTWGASVNDAMRHIEAFEFLFECELQQTRLGNS
ncbi:MAG: methylthioribulose 1-phosphate dehydratase [Gammaproteobacteria bacterium]|nr:methylthioribulose 1-phosphate dehydratase [Gammaproteobacteria bacterium]MCP5137529.1 methylthioribulose 1-phosphate dehydratase [Gammaproteobacteria bacterium]